MASVGLLFLSFQLLQEHFIMFQVTVSVAPSAVL
jgi:hypothetical protein